jgi:hypothetical protein
MKYKDAKAQEMFLSGVQEDFTTAPDCDCSVNPNTILRYILIVILIVLIAKSIHLILSDN